MILPLTVLRRLDCVLAPTKDKVLAKQAELRGRKLENLDPQLRRASGFAFYNYWRRKPSNAPSRRFWTARQRTSTRS